MRPILQAGILYFVCVFGAGFVLGPIRVLWLVPRLGTRLAELLEMPVMLAVIVIVARWIVRRCTVPPSTWQRLGIGLLALSLVLALEFSVVLWLQGLTPGEALAQRDPVAGTVYVMSLVVFAIMPLLVERR